MLKVLLAGGGTGGHINPALAIASIIKQHHPDAEFLFAGTPNGMEANLIPKAGYDFAPIKISGFQRKITPKNLVRHAKAAAYLSVSGHRSKQIINGFKPDIVIGTGGYVSYPILAKAVQMGIPTAIHEQNAFPGITNRLLAKKVDEVMLTVEEAAQHLDACAKYTVTGLPVRAGFSAGAISRAEAKKKLGFDDGICIFSFGGSLGAGAINNGAAALIKWEKENKLPVNHIHGYGKMGTTIARLYAGQVKADSFASTARGYRSAREAALYPDEIDESVYDSLIDAVHGGLPTLCEYLSIRKEQLGIAQLHMYDLYAKTGDGFDVKMDIDEAFETFLEAVKPLGGDYVADASRALSERWIDVYETKNKRGGAYSNAVYKTTPYVLLNHTRTYDGLSTLCHEMGHAMHSYYSSKTQPFAKADYTIFVAEVASTCNEILLYEHLMNKHAGDRKAQIALIGSMLEHFRTTVFRQTMFDEFEHKAHRMAEEGQSLTKESL